jgi:cytochrome P450
VYQALGSLLDALMENILSLALFVPGAEHFPTRANRHVKREIDRMRRLLRGIIAEQRAARAAKQAQGQAQAHLLIDFLLDARDPDASAASAASVASAPSGPGAFSDAEILDEAMTFVTAGHETTAQAISWALLLLCQHPEWQARVRAEVRGVCGGGDSAPVFADLARMPDLQCVVWEALRLYPPAPMVVRTALRDVRIAMPRRPARGTASSQAPTGGSEAGSESLRARHPASADQASESEEGASEGFTLTIKQGTTVVIPVAAIHRDPEYWTNPDTFDPDRFRHGLPAASSHPFAYLPFVHGPRSCIGSSFALTEAKLVLACLLQRMEFRASPRYRHFPMAAVTLRPHHGMPMLVRPVDPVNPAAATAQD